MVMPSSYKRTYGRKKSFFKRKRFSPSKTIQKLWRAVRATRKQAIGELAVSDQDISLSNQMWDGGVVLDLNNISIGSSVESRTGRKQKVNSVNIKLNANFTADLEATLTSAEWLSTYLIIDKRRNGSTTAPVLTDIFDITTSGFLVRNRDAYKQFDIINIKMHKGDLIGTQSEGKPAGQSAIYTFYKKFKGGLMQTYNATGGSTCIHNGLYLLFYSPNAADTLDINGFKRMTYYDF